VRLVGREAITLLHKVGVRMAYGSDLLGPSHSHQSEELRIRSQLIGNLETLRSATVVAADVLQRTGQLGVVRQGAIADLLVVRGNPMEDIEVLVGQGEKLAAIMKAGRFFKNELSGA
jgi:imidazolonepropionase-like amidohydrolase